MHYTIHGKPWLVRSLSRKKKLFSSTLHLLSFLFAIRFISTWCPQCCFTDISNIANQLVVLHGLSMTNESSASSKQVRFLCGITGIQNNKVNTWTVDVGNTMQLYHHPFSLDSQKVRLVLEEKNIDYTSFHVNPITGKNFDSSFFRKNPSAKLPVFQNGSHIIYDTIEIIQYVLFSLFL